MAVLTQEDTKILSQSVFKKLASNNPNLVKEAEDAVNEFTRRKMREQAFLRHILPPLNLTNDELDRQVHTARRSRLSTWNRIRSPRLPTGGCGSRWVATVTWRRPHLVQA